MLNKCIHMKLRHKKGQVYYYCTNKRAVIDFKQCNSCLNKEYKKVSKMVVKKPIKKVSKKRITVSKETYDEVYERDKGCCRLCGNNSIQLHHIRYRSESKDLIDVPSNCIMLCLKCHKLVHSNKKKYQPILLNMVKEKLK